MDKDKKKHALDAGKKRLEDFRKRKAAARKGVGENPEDGPEGRDDGGALPRPGETSDRGELIQPKMAAAPSKSESGTGSNAFSIDLSAYLTSIPEPPPEVAHEQESSVAHEQETSDPSDTTPVAGVPRSRPGDRAEEDVAFVDAEEAPAEPEGSLAGLPKPANPGDVLPGSSEMERPASRQPSISTADRQEHEHANGRMTDGEEGQEAPQALRQEPGAGPEGGTALPEDAQSKASRTREELTVAIRSRLVDSSGESPFVRDPDSGFFTPDDTPSSSPSARSDSSSGQRIQLEHQSGKLGALTAGQGSVGVIEQEADGPTSSSEAVSKEVKQLQEELAAMRVENEALRSSLLEAKVAVGSREAELRDVRGQASQMAAEIARLSHDSVSLRDEVSKSDQRLGAVREKLTMAVKKGKEVVQQREVLKGSLAEQAAEVGALSAENVALKAELSSRQTALEAAAQRVEVLEGEVEKVTQERESLSRALENERRSRELLSGVASQSEETAHPESNAPGGRGRGPSKEEIPPEHPVSGTDGSLAPGQFQAAEGAQDHGHDHESHISLHSQGEAVVAENSSAIVAPSEESAAGGLATGVLMDPESQLAEGLQKQQSLAEELAAAKQEVTDARAATALERGEELERVRDALEIKVVELERQAADAKLAMEDYDRLKLKTEEMALLSDTYNKAVAEMEALKDRATGLEAQLQSERDTHAAEMRAKMVELRVVTEKESQLRHELTLMQVQLSASNEELRGSRLQAAKLEDVAREQESEIARLQAEAAQRMEALDARLQETLAEKEEFKQKMERDMAGAQLQAAKLEQLMEQKQLKDRKLEEASRELERLEGDKVALATRLEELSGEAAREQESEIARVQAEAAQRMEALDARLQEILAEKEEFKQKLEDASRERESEIARVQAEAAQRLEALDARLQEALAEKEEFKQKMERDMAGAQVQAAELEQLMKQKQLYDRKLEEAARELERLAGDRIALATRLEEVSGQLEQERASVKLKSQEVAIVGGQAERLGLQLFEEQQKVEDLEVRQEQLEATFAAETDALRKALEVAEQELVTAQDTVQELNVRVSDLGAEEVRAKAEVQSLSATLTSSKARERELEDLASDATRASEGDKARLEAALVAESQSKEEMESLRASLVQASLDLESLREEDARLSKASAQAREAEVRATEECRALGQALQGAQAEAASLTKKLDEALAGEASKMKGIEEACSAAESRSEDALRQLADAHARIYTLEAEKAKLDDQPPGGGAHKSTNPVGLLEQAAGGSPVVVDTEPTQELRGDLAKAHEQIATTREKLRKAVAKGKSIQEQKATLEKDLAAAHAEVATLKEALNETRAEADSATKRAATAESALKEALAIANDVAVEMQRLKGFESIARSLEAQVGEMQEQNEVDMKAVMEARELARAKAEAQAQLLQDAREHSSQLAEEVESLSQELSAAKGELETLQMQLEAEQRSKAEELQRASAGASALKAAKEAAEDSEKSAAALRQRLGQREAELGQLSATLAAAKEELISKQQEIDGLRGDLSSAEASREEVAQAERKLGKLTATATTLEEECARLRAEACCAKDEAEELARTLGLREEEIERLRAQLLEEQQAAVALRRSLEEAGRRYEDEAAGQMSKAECIDEMTARLGSVEAEVKILQEALARKEEQLELAQERIRAAEVSAKEADELRAALSATRDELEGKEQEACGREEAAAARLVELQALMAEKEAEKEALRQEAAGAVEAKDFAHKEASRLRDSYKGELMALQEALARESRELQAKAEEAERRAEEVSRLRADAEERERTVQSLAAAKGKALAKLTATVDRLKDIQAQSEAVVAEADARLQAQAEELEAARGEGAKLQADLDAALRDLSSANQRLEVESRSLREEAAAQEAAANELRGELEGALREVQALRGQLREQESVVVELRRQGELVAQDKALKAELEDLQQQLQRMSAEAETLRASLRWRDAELEELRSESEGLLAEAESWRASTEQKAEQLEESRQEAAQLLAEAQALRSALEARETELGRVSAEANTASGAVSRWEGRVEAMRREMDDLRAKIEQQRRVDLRQSQSMQASTSAPSLVVSPRLMRKPPSLRVDIESPPVPGSPTSYDDGDESKPEFRFQSIVSAYPSLPNRAALLAAGMDRLSVQGCRVLLSQPLARLVLFGYWFALHLWMAVMLSTARV